MKVEIDVIKPNVLVYPRSTGYSIFFSLRRVSDAIPISLRVASEMRRYAGELSHGDIPLKKYLKEVEKSGFPSKQRQRSEPFSYINNLIRSVTFSDPKAVANFLNLRRDLQDPNMTFDNFEDEDIVYRVDRRRTLENMRAFYRKLARSIPDYIGFYYLEELDNGEILGNLGVFQAKAKTRPRLTSKNSLVSAVKTADGAPLSYSVDKTFSQYTDLYADRQTLLGQYGNVLSREWQSKLFKHD